MPLSYVVGEGIEEKLQERMLRDREMSRFSPEQTTRYRASCYQNPCESCVVGGSPCVSQLQISYQRTDLEMMKRKQVDNSFSLFLLLFKHDLIQIELFSSQRLFLNDETFFRRNLRGKTEKFFFVYFVVVET
jgi:hypothetical protein